MTHIQSYQKLFSDFDEWKNQGWDITPSEERLLQLYIGNFFSVYDIQSYLKTAVGPKNMHRIILRSTVNPTVNTTDYKNVHRRIQKLKSLKLIEEARSIRNSNHGAKYYKLSEKGLCYILLKISSFIGEYLNTTHIFKLLHLNYPENFIFRIFLYPYLGASTIERIYGTHHVNAIWLYLRRCCESIQDLTNLKAGGEQIFVWSDVQPKESRNFRELKDKRLAEFLKKRFNLNWLDQAVISKLEDDNMIKILHQDKLATIELIENNTKALLRIGRKEKLKMNVTVLVDKKDEAYVFDICAPSDSTQHTQQMRLENTLKMVASKLVLELLSYPLIENDIEALSQDSKFVKLLNRVSQEFNDRCNLINKKQSA